MNGMQKYKMEIFSLLNCSDREKAWYASLLNDLLGDQSEILSFEEISQKLGTPADWVASRIENLETVQNISETEQIKKKAIQFRITVAVIILCILLLLAYFVWWDIKNRGTGGYYSEPHPHIGYSREFCQKRRF